MLLFVLGLSCLLLVESAPSNTQTCVTSPDGLSTIYNCLTSCQNVPDGDYQSCSGCNVYATCSNGYITDKRPCSATLTWDDGVAACNFPDSTSCVSCNALSVSPAMPYPQPAPIKAPVVPVNPVAQPINPPSAGQTCVFRRRDNRAVPRCMSSCQGFDDGDYQSCNGCGFFATCSNGALYTMPCPSGLVWNNRLRDCDYQDPSSCVACPPPPTPSNPPIDAPVPAPLPADPNQPAPAPLPADPNQPAPAPLPADPNQPAPAPLPAEPNPPASGLLPSDPKKPGHGNKPAAKPNPPGHDNHPAAKPNPPGHDNHPAAKPNPPARPLLPIHPVHDDEPPKPKKN